MDADGTGSNRERLDDVAAALSSAQRNLQAYLAEFEAAASDGDEAHAVEYEKTAALLRRRALQPHRSEQERTELRRRAEWFGRRAAVKREGLIMPRELRTPLETLELVDDVRQVLLGLSIAIAHLGPEDLLAFRQAVDCGEGAALAPLSPAAVAEPLVELNAVLHRTLGLLGTQRAADDGTITVLPFSIPLAVASDQRP